VSKNLPGGIITTQAWISTATDGQPQQPPPQHPPPDGAGAAAREPTGVRPPSDTVESSFTVST
jgi:hypothetical protein